MNPQSRRHSKLAQAALGALLAAVMPLPPLAARAAPRPAAKDLHALFLFTNVDRKPDLQKKFGTCIESAGTSSCRRARG